MFGLKILRWLLVVYFLTVIIACTSSREDCSQGWRITGYYTPVESEFVQTPSLSVNASGKHYRFSKEFLAAVRMEGWGRTRFGWYLGYYSGGWHRSSTARDAKGNGLVVGMAAMKRGRAMPNHLRIDGLETVLGRSVFKVSDTGSGLKSKQVDIYTGEGSRARQLTYAITREHARVCRVL